MLLPGRRALTTHPPPWKPLSDPAAQGSLELRPVYTERERELRLCEREHERGFIAV